MNFLEKFKQYGSWAVKSVTGFSQSDIAMIRSAKVEDTEYGVRLCLYLNSGHKSYVALSTDSKMKVGDDVDVSKVNIITLTKPGEEDVYRAIEA